MNINQIKAFTWLLSAGLTVGVGYYVYDFQQRQAVWTTESRIPPKTAEAILESAVAPEGPKFSLIEREAIERAYYYDPANRQLPNLLDWSGAPPKVVEVAPAPVDDAPVTQVESIGDKISILMIYHGQAWIQYNPGSGVAPPADPKRLTVLKVGDTLAKPLDYATVKAIHGQRGVTFSFEGGEREEETVPSKQYDPGSEVYIAKGDGGGIRAHPTSIPRREAVWQPEHTTRLSGDIIRIGTVDQQEFAEDFGGILAREVRHARHYNPTTRQYDGIELKSVAPGGKISAHGGQSGDIIKSINGHTVTSSSEAISFVKNNQDKYSKWIVVIENKGKERTMTFESPTQE
jgi:hypothetical protein